MTEPRILVLDIETAPLESFTWGTWDQTVGLEQIKTEWSILSFAAKWLGEKNTVYFDTSGHGAKNVRDDSKLLVSLWSLLDEADIVIAQNGQAFDLKKINARMLMAGMKPYSPIRVIDTMLIAKKHFGFTSNKLAWLTKHLTSNKKSEHKVFPGFELWTECLKDNPKAWAEMRKYNIQDVVSTEELYMTLRPWVEGHPNVAAFGTEEVLQCPKCGSKSVVKRGLTYTQTGEYVKFQCKACSGWSRSRYTVNTKEKRKNLLSN
jgi:hypothetical protein